MNNDVVMDAAREVEDSYKCQDWYRCKCINKQHCSCFHNIGENSTKYVSDSDIVERMNKLLSLSSNLGSFDSGSSLAINDNDSEYIYKYTPLEETSTIDNINESRIDKFSYSLKLRKRLPDISLEKRNKLGETPLHIACKRRNIKEIANLLDAGANINEQDYASWTPLHEAVLVGNIAIVKLLLKRGSVVNAPGHNYTTPLHYAASTKAIELCKLLVKYGANMFTMCFMGLTPTDHMSAELQQELLATPSTKQRTISIPWPRRTVFYIMGEKSQVLENVLQHFMFILDFTIADEIDQTVTHVIVNSKEKIIAPSYELLLAIVHMIPVVTVEWLHACVEYDELMSYEDYYIIGTDKFQCEGVRNSQSNKFKLNPKLFSHCNFYISVGTGCKVDDVTLSAKQLEELISIGGGKILKREPTVQSIGGSHRCYPWHAPSDTSISQCAHYIVYDPKPNPELLYRMKDLKHVPYHWVYESILRFQLIPPELIQIP